VTAREAILQYLVGVLATVDGATLYRSRYAAFTAEEGIAVLLDWTEEAPAGALTPASSTVSQDLTISLSVIARASDPQQSADEVADQVIQSVHQLVMAERTLGGRCALLVRAGTKKSAEMGDQYPAVIEMLYRARYATNASDLSALS